MQKHGDIGKLAAARPPSKGRPSTLVAVDAVEIKTLLGSR